ncbi:MAG: hypothetical protein FWE74_04790 [Oscillospiraceae bacterium]|nr:hypothetical protein [Oscillospiraceae bacterium]
MSNKDEIINELYILTQKLKFHEHEFNLTDDDDLIEALIYEQKALQSRFSCLMKRARELEIEVGFFDRCVIESKEYN